MEAAERDLRSALRQLVLVERGLRAKPAPKPARAPVALTRAQWILRKPPRRYAPGPMLSAIDHVGIAVENIDAALLVYQDSLGLPLVHRETVVDQGVDAALLGVGDGHVELLQPLSADTTVGKFLARRGPGLHHVAYRVGDIEGALSECRQAGLRMIDDHARVGIRGSRVAFLHPSATAGVLTELVEPAENQ